MAVLKELVLLKRAKVPTATFALPVWLEKSAAPPMAVLKRPLLSFVSVPSPTAVFNWPVVLLESALEPTAVFSWPVLLLKSASKPNAVLLGPVLFKSASSPRTVFWFVKQPSWQTARAAGESAKQPSANGMRRNARKGERLIKLLNGRVVVFICAEF